MMPCVSPRDALISTPLRARAIPVNAMFDPPLADDEFERVIASAWSYEAKNENWVGQEQNVRIPISQLNTLASFPNGGDATLLVMKLKAAHWDGSSFAAVPRAMAASGFIPSWGEWTYRAALKTAEQANVLRRTRQGGRGPNDPALYAFRT